MTLRRYASAAHAVATYLQLRTRLEGSAMDLAVQEIRAHGACRTEPDGLDDIMALKRALERTRAACGEDRWLIWESMRLNGTSAPAAASAHNTRCAEANLRAHCISKTTAANWRTATDALFEQELEREGILLRNATPSQRDDHG